MLTVHVRLIVIMAMDATEDLVVGTDRMTS